MRFQNVKGTRDFYPPEMALRLWLMQQWRDVSRRYGFEEYDGPTFEYLDLYTTKSGEGIVSELYHFEDRGGRRLALRPEMTPTLARMVAARAESLPKPIKWFSMPSFFRAERPQRGRLREFQQWNVDIVGTPGEAEALADADCIGVAVDFLRQVGFSCDQAVMKISSRELLVHLLGHIGIDANLHQMLYGVLDKREKLPGEVFEAELDKLGISSEQKGHLVALGQAKGAQALDLVSQLGANDSKVSEAVDHLRQTMDVLGSMGMLPYCEIDLGIVRGLAYYTGIVFEAYSKGTLGRAICGGGRYANLLKDMGGGTLSGVGFGMGDVIVLDQLQEFGLLQEVNTAVDFYVFADGDTPAAQVTQLAQVVRNDLGRSCSVSYKRASLKKQLQLAAKQKFEYVVIVGETLSIKHMPTGLQEEIDTAPSHPNAQVSAAIQAFLKKTSG